MLIVFIIVIIEESKSVPETPETIAESFTDNTQIEFPPPESTEFQQTDDSAQTHSASYPEQKIPEHLEMVLSFFLKHNLTLTALEDLLLLVNKIIIQCDGSKDYILPTSKYLFKKIFGRTVIEYHTKCTACDKFSITNQLNERKKCTNAECKSPIIPKETNFFVYMPIGEQLKEIIERNVDEIDEYSSNVKKVENNVITDIQNSRLYKESFKGDDEKFHITLTLNTDGVQVFK